MAEQVTYLIVDELHQNIPELTKDQYWNSTDFHLPYTEATIRYQKEAVLGSAADIEYVVPRFRSRRLVLNSCRLQWGTTLTLVNQGIIKELQTFRH